MATQSGVLVGPPSNISQSGVLVTPSLQQIWPQHQQTSAIQPYAPYQNPVAIQPGGFQQPAYQPPTAFVPPQINESGARRFLAQNGFSTALQDLFIQQVLKIPIRFFICDDSGSMNLDDGQRLTSLTGNGMKISCSRWAEMTDTMRFHLELAHEANAISEFTLLNQGTSIRVGTGDINQSSYEKSQFLRYLDGDPGGGTPLCEHITKIVGKIKAIEPTLRQRGQKACIIIVTDGAADDGNIADALKPLKGLPVWVIVRLCTSDTSIGDIYNDLDKVVEGVEMDVLDDLFGEAEEIKSKNPWITYNAFMHRMREFGCGSKELDLLDERSLSATQLHGVCALLLGGGKESYPHPEQNWKGFKNAVEVKLRSDPNNKVFNLITGRKADIIDVRAMSTIYGKGAGCCTVS